MSETEHGIEGCAAAEQATADRPCWGGLMQFDEVYDAEANEEFLTWDACEGHYDGMFIGGDPCDLTAYRSKP